MKVTKFEWIHDTDYQYTSSYFTHNKWIDENTLVLARTASSTVGAGDYSSERCELVCVCLKDGTKTVLTDDCNGPFFLAHNNIIYYTAWDCLKTVNTIDGEIRVLFENPFYPGKETARLVHPHITNDGKTMGVYVQCRDNPSVFITLDAETGELLHSFEKIFDRPDYRAEHGMLCPANPELMYFCREGKGNRMWLGDMKTGEHWPIAIQRVLEDGRMGDLHGHEMWAPDGKGLYFVKYANSPIKPAGICYVDAATGHSQVLYSGYSYWHVGVSSDGRWLLADTLPQSGFTGVVIIDLESGTERLVDVVRTTGAHPTHPHPQLSPDGKKLMYSTLDDHNRVAVKLAYIDYDK